MPVKITQATVFGKRIFPLLAVALSLVVMVAGVATSIYIAHWWQVEITPTQAFAWGIAAVVALVLWPTVQVAQRRMTWEKLQEEHKRLGAPEQAFDAQPPDHPVSAAEKLLRAAAFAVGAAALLVLVGSQPIARAIQAFIDYFSTGRQSFWALTQLLALVISLVPAGLVMWGCEKRVWQHPAGSPEWEREMQRVDWWVNLLIAWGMSLFAGQILAWVILAYL